MKTSRLDHARVIVNDLPAAKAFFLDLGLELLCGEGFGVPRAGSDARTQGAKTTGLRRRMADKKSLPLSSANTRPSPHRLCRERDLTASVAKLSWTAGGHRAVGAGRATRRQKNGPESPAQLERSRRPITHRARPHPG